MVKRTLYLKKIRPFYNSEMIKVITGVRRCGKSVILRQIMEELQESSPKKNIIYINLEDYDYNHLINPDNLHSYIKQRLVKNKTTYILLDEIQNVDGFELIINSLRATDKVSIFITGSNSKLLSGELATHLAGRTVSFTIMPFCFQEYCDFLITEGREQPKDSALQDYIRWGGFPLVCKETNPAVKEVILANIYDSVILKDIILRNPVSSAPMLEKLIEYLIANSSCTLSGNNIAKALSALYAKISAPTVYEYIKYITDACICSKVERYDIKGKKALAFQEKIYACDTGLLQLKKNRASQEFGKLIETVCHNELIARGYRVYVGKTRTGEVDFIAERGSEKFYLQATYLLATPEVVEREFGAYKEVQDNFPKYVVSMDPIQIQRDGIIHMSLMDFLSQPV